MNLMASGWERQREQRRRLVGRREVGRWPMKQRLSVPVEEERELLVRNDCRKPVLRLLDQAVGWLVRRLVRREIVHPVPILPPAWRVWAGRPVWAAPAVPA